MSLGPRPGQYNGAGADLGFSRGGGEDFPKCFENFVDLFYRSTILILRALSKHYNDPDFGQNHMNPKRINVVLNN